MSDSHNSHIEYTIVKPDTELADFVESYWMLVNHANAEKDVIVLPDGRIDIFFSYSSTEDFTLRFPG